MSETVIEETIPPDEPATFQFVKSTDELGFLWVSGDEGATNLSFDVIGVASGLGSDLEAPQSIEAKHDVDASTEPQPITFDLDGYAKVEVEATNRSDSEASIEAAYKNH